MCRKLEWMLVDNNKREFTLPSWICNRLKKFLQKQGVARLPVKMGGEEFSSILYHGDTYMGELSIYPQYEDTELMNTVKNEIRISHFSSPSKRCLPSVVLHSISSSGVCFKMKPKEQQS